MGTRLVFLLPILSLGLLASSCSQQNAEKPKTISPPPAPTEPAPAATPPAPSISDAEKEILARLNEDIGKDKSASGSFVSGEGKPSGKAKPDNSVAEGEKAKAYAVDCVRRIQSGLKDPESLRILDNPNVSLQPDGKFFVTTRVSATNSYGGRISKFYFCTYQGDRLVNFVSA